MSNLGSRLREEREARGLSLSDVVRETRIQLKFIVAIEDDRLDLLPGQAYVRGFVGTYARYLGLHEDEFVGASTTTIASTTPARIPTVIDEPLTLGASPIRWAAVAVLGLVLVITLSIVGWSAYSRFYLHRDPWQRFDLPGMVARAFVRGGAPVATPEPSAPVVTSATTPLPGSEAEGAGTRVPDEVPPPSAAPTQTPSPGPLSSPTPRPLVAAPTAEVATPGSSPTPTEPPPADVPRAPIQIVARATADVWLGVTADGRTVYAQTLTSGSEMTWDASESVSFRVGNAGGLDLTVNGVAVGRLGASGEVIDVEYTLGNLPQP